MASRQDLRTWHPDTSENRKNHYADQLAAVKTIERKNAPLSQAGSLAVLDDNPMVGDCGRHIHTFD
jgi:hypothetical protein